MEKHLNIQGCDNITNLICVNIDKMLGYALVSDYVNAKKYVEKINHDGNILKQFMSNTSPQWLEPLLSHCQAFIQKKCNSQDYAQIVKGINEIFFQIKNFSWASYVSPDLDYIFLEYMKELNYNELLEKLAEHFEKILLEYRDNLSASQIFNLTNIIQGLRSCKNKSESAISTWLYCAKNLIDTLCPQFEAVPKFMELLKQTAVIYDESCLLLLEIKNKVICKMQKQFCDGDKIAMTMPSTHVKPKILEEAKKIRAVTQENNSSYND